MEKIPNRNRVIRNAHKKDRNKSLMSNAMHLHP